MKRIFYTTLLVFLSVSLSAQEVVPGIVVFKLEQRADGAARILPGQAAYTLDRATSYLSRFSLQEVNPVMPASSLEALHQQNFRAKSRSNTGAALPDDLTRTYIARISEGANPWFVSSKLAKLPGIEYAEPYFLMKTTQVIPNDSLIGAEGQDYYGYQRFFDAWGVTTSSENVVIAIIDTGVDYNHPDLKSKLWRNPEPGRAKALFPELFAQVENDTIGWNFWKSGPITDPVQSANPMPEPCNECYHGTHVAGIAAAATNNRIGIAGTGFNSRYMAVRAGGTLNDPRSVGFGFQAILYAAANGADVINCSWGGTAYSRFGDDVVTLANAMGSVIVGAAGNNANDIPFFPAAYDEVLSVGSVTHTLGGTRSYFSNYGYFVDVMATGQGIKSTFRSNDYFTTSGTSMSAPVVAGLAALVGALHPDWNAARVRGHIRSSANAAIYDLNSASMAEKMGGGLLDAYKAVQTDLPAFVVVSASFNGPDGKKLKTKEDGVLTVTIRNTGAPAINAVLSVAAVTEFTRILADSDLMLGFFDHGEVRELTIGIRLEEAYDFNYTPQVRIGFEDQPSAYTDFRHVFYENYIYEVIDVNTIYTSVASNGAIGFSDAFRESGGVGFIPRRQTETGLEAWPNLLYEAGLMLELEADTQRYVLNRVRATFDIDNDFLPVELFQVVEPGLLSEGDGHTVFNTSNVPSAPRLSIRQETYAFNDTDINNVLFVKYTLRNDDADLRTLRRVYAGLFADWDIGNYEANRAAWSAPDSVLYVFSETDDLPYVAVAHLGNISSAFAIDNAYPGITDSLHFGIYYLNNNPDFTGFTDQKKSWAMRAGTQKTTVDQADVSVVTASGPYTVDAGAAVTVGFLMAFGETPEALRAQIAAARSRALFSVTPTSLPVDRAPLQLPLAFEVHQNYPNPFNPQTTIRVSLPGTTPLVARVFDATGRVAGALAAGTYPSGEHTFTFDAQLYASGLYLLRVETVFGVQTIKMTLLK